MATRAYGQYCGFARALEVIGERWALMIIRDLLVSPKRFSDLHRGLPGIPTNVLSARLKELEEAGVVHRRVMPRPERGIAYELTDYGNELETVVFDIGRWGAKALGNPRDGETITTDSIVTALRTTFQPDAAKTIKASYELLMGPVVVHATIDRGKLEVAEGALPDADLTIEAGPQLRSLMAHEMSADEAVKSGAVRIRGDKRLLKQFAEIFRI